TGQEVHRRYEHPTTQTTAAGSAALLKCSARRVRQTAAARRLGRQPLGSKPHVPATGFFAPAPQYPAAAHGSRAPHSGDAPATRRAPSRAADPPPGAAVAAIGNGRGQSHPVATAGFATARPGPLSGAAGPASAAARRPGWVCPRAPAEAAAPAAGTTLPRRAARPPARMAGRAAHLGQRETHPRRCTLAGTRGRVHHLFARRYRLSRRWLLRERLHRRAALGLHH